MISDAYIKWAHVAVDEWDGQDDGELLKLIAEHFGKPLDQIVWAGRMIVEQEAREYAELPATLHRVEMRSPGIRVVEMPPPILSDDFTELTL